MRVYTYKSIRKVDEEKFMNKLNSIHIFNDGNMVVAKIVEGTIYFQSNTTLTHIEMDKIFPNAFEYADSIPSSGDELFNNC